MDLSLNGIGKGNLLTLPRTNLIMLIRKIGDVLTPDCIGLLITRDQVDESFADIFFNGAAKRADAASVTLALASDDLNTAGGTLYGSANFGIALYAIGSQPVEASERRLWRKIFGTQFEPFYVDGVVLQVDGNSIYLET